MDDLLIERIHNTLERFKEDYIEEVKRLSKSGGVSEEEELESADFLKALLLLVAERSVPSKSAAKKIYNNLRHF